MSDQPQSSKSAEAPAERRPCWGRRIGIAVGALVVLLALLVALAPTLLSFGPGKSLVQSIAADAVPGGITFDGLSLGWFSGQRITGLKITDPDGAVVLEADQIDVPDATLASLAGGSLDLGTVRIVKPVLPVEQDAEGNINLLRALSDPNAPKSDEPTTLPAGLRVKVVIEDPQVSYAAPGLEKVQLDDADVALEITDPTHIHTAFKATVRQGEAAGSVDAKLTLQDLFDAAGLMQQNKASVDANVKLADIPVAVADALLELKGQLRECVGPTLNADLVAKLEAAKATGPVTLTLESQRLNGRVTGTLSEGRVDLDEGSALTATLTPALLAAVTKANEALADHLKQFAIDGQTDVKLTINRLSAPFDAKPGGTVFDGQVTIGAFTAKPDADTNIAINATRIAAVLDGKAGTLRATWLTDATHAGSPAKVDLTADATGLIDEAGELDVNSATVALKGALTDVFVALLDGQLGLDGLLTEAVGPTLTAEVDARVTLAAKPADMQGTFTLTTSSDRVDGRYVGELSGGQLMIKPTTKATFSLTPALHAKLGEVYPELVAQLKQVELPRAAPVTLAVGQASVPLEGFALNKVSADATLTVGDFNAVADEKTKLTLRDTKLTLDFDGPTGKADATLTGLTSTAAGKSATTDLTANVTRLFNQDGGFDVKRAAVALNGGIGQAPVPLIDAMAGMKGALVALVGDAMGLQVNGKVELAENPLESTGGFTIQAKSDRLDTTLVMAVSGGAVQLAPKTQATLTLTPAARQALITAYPQLAEPLGKLELPGPTPLALNVNRASAQLEGFALNKVTADAVVTLGTVDAVADPKARVTLNDTALAVTFDGPTKKASAKWTGKTVAGGKTSDVDLTANVTGLLDDKGEVTTNGARVGLKGKVGQAPVAMADALGNLDGMLVELVGAAMDVDVDADVMLAEKTQDITGTLALTAKADRLDATLGGTIDNGVLTLKPDAKAKVTLTPKLARVLLTPKPDAVEQSKDADSRVQPVSQPASASASASKPAEPSVELVAPTPLTLDVKALRVPLSMDLRQAQVDATFTAENAAVHDKQRDVTIALSDLVIKVTNEEEPGAFAVSLDAITRARWPGRDEPAEGKLTSKNRLANLTDKDGKPQFAKANISTHTRADGLPLSLVDSLGGFVDPRLVDLMGPFASALIQVAYEPGKDNDLNVRLLSEASSIVVEGTLGDKLTLRNDAEAALEVTPALSKALIRKINPVIDALSAEEPIRLTLKKEGFVVPIKDYALKDVKSSATLEMGTLQLSSQGELIKLLRLIPGFKLPQTLEATFTPLNVNMAGGVVAYKNMTMTIDKLVIGFDGRVDLVNNRVDLAMRIPGEALAALIKDERGRIGKGDDIVMPITGTMQNPTLDQKLFAQKMQDLALKVGVKAGLSELLKDKGGDEGKAIGNLLDLLGGDKNKSTPPPKQDPPKSNQAPDASQSKNDGTPPSKKKDPVGDVLDLFDRLNKKDQDKEKK